MSRNPSTLRDPSTPVDLSRRRGKQRGHLSRTAKSWVAQWWERVRMPDGHRKWTKKKRAICPSSKTQKEARRIFEEVVLVGLESRSRYPETMATLAEFWKQKFEPTLIYRKRKGREHYYYIVEKLILPILGKFQMREIGLGEVQALVDQRWGEEYSVQTLLHIRHVLSKLFKYAKQLKWYSGDLPTEGLQLPEYEAKERVALTKEQFLSLVVALPSPAREMVFVLGLMGLRVSELVGLKWKRMNLTEALVLVDGESIPPLTAAIREQFLRVGRRQKVDPVTGEKSPVDPNEPYGQYQSLKKAAQRRESSAKRNVPLQPTLVGLLLQIKAQSKFAGPEDPVFSSKNGTPIDAHNVLQDKIKPVLRKLGLPNLSWHDLRHTCNTWAGEFLTVEERKKMFGWSQDRMASLYNHPDFERMRERLEIAFKGLEWTEKEIVQ